MFGKTLSAWFVTFLIVLGILPGGKSKCCDWIGFLVWLTISTVVSIAWIYVTKDLMEDYFKNLSIARLIQLSTSYFTPICQIIGTVLALSTASKRYPWLVNDSKLPPPDCLVLFLIVTISNIVYVCLQPVTEGKEFQDMFSKYTALMVYVLFAERVYISSIIVGLCVAQLKRSIQRKEDITSPYTAILFGEKIVNEFRSLKWFLSPVMFALFLVNSLNVIGDGYFILHMSILGLVPRLVSAFLTLGYVCLVIDGCFGEFKSVAETLR